MNHSLNSAIRGVLLAAAAAALSACGGGGGYSEAPAAVAPPATTNTPPTISRIASQSLQQDASGDVIAFEVSDAESSAALITVAVESSDPALISADGVQLAGAGATRTLLLTPLDDASGTATITVVAADPAGLSTRRSFDVAVTGEQRSYRDMVGVAYALDADSEGERTVGYQWIDHAEDDDAAFDHLFTE